MSILHSQRTIILCTSAAILSACAQLEFAHVAPGKSARRAAEPPPPAITPPFDLSGSPTNLPPGALPTPAGPLTDTLNQPPLAPLVAPPLPDIPPAPALPAANDTASAVTDAYTRGSTAMHAGKNAEAIPAFEEAVKLDPGFSDAWSKLVILYTKEGQTAKATVAYKKAKSLGQQNGPEASSHGLLP